MPSIYQLKPAFQAMLRPAMKAFVAIGLSPNHVTVAACVGSIGLGAWLICDPEHIIAWFCVPVWLFVRMALNAIDGMMAREYQLQSPLGAILNELGDVIADTVLFLPFLFLADVQQGLVLAFIGAAILTEMAGVIAVQIGATRRYDGPMGKSDRACIIGIIALAYAVGWRELEWFNYTFAVMAGLCVVCVVNRIRAALREIEDV